MKPQIPSLLEVVETFPVFRLLIEYRFGNVTMIESDRKNNFINDLHKNVV
jgi:hypothetical protein